MGVIKCSGPTVQPVYNKQKTYLVYTRHIMVTNKHFPAHTFHPVALKDFPALPIVTVLAHMPGKVAEHG